VVVVHLLFIGFVVGGVFLAWRWPRIVWAHIPAVIYGALVEFASVTCPLTVLENDLRRHAGEGGYRGGFIAHYLVKVVYPPGLTRGCRSGWVSWWCWWRPSGTGGSCAGIRPAGSGEGAGRCAQGTPTGPAVATSGRRGRSRQHTVSLSVSRRRGDHRGARPHPRVTPPYDRLHAAETPGSRCSRAFGS